MEPCLSCSSSSSRAPQKQVLGMTPRARGWALALVLALPGAGIALPFAGIALVAAVPARAEEPAPSGPELATPPRLRQDVPPELPLGTVFPAPEVTVVLQIDVSADGSVERVALLEGAGEPFDGAAVAAAQRYAFDPARLTTGAPVPVTITYRLKITPPDPPPAPPPRPLSPAV